MLAFKNHTFVFYWNCKLGTKNHKLQSKCKPKIYRNTCRTILFPDKSELLWSSLAPKLRIRVFGIFVCLHCSELLLQGLLLGFLRKQDKQGKISYIN